MTTAELHFDGNTPRLYLGGHRLRVLWGVAAVLWVAVAWDWRRGW